MRWLPWFLFVLCAGCGSTNRGFDSTNVEATARWFASLLRPLTTSSDRAAAEADMRAQLNAASLVGREVNWELDCKVGEDGEAVLLAQFDRKGRQDEETPILILLNLKDRAWFGGGAPVITRYCRVLRGRDVEDVNRLTGRVTARARIAAVEVVKDDLGSRTMIHVYLEMIDVSPKS